MKPFARFGLVMVAMALLLSGCIPVRTISERLTGGSSQIGPSWPVSVSIPLLKGKTVDVGEGLDGFQGGRGGPIWSRSTASWVIAR